MDEDNKKYLKEEFDAIQLNPNTCTGCTAGLKDKSDYFNWKVSLVGPKDSLYSGGLFFLNIIFPPDYPKSKPKIKFLTPIYHPNVCPIKTINSQESLGYISDCFLNYWNNSTTAREIITKLYYIFYTLDTNKSYSKEIADEYLQNKALFEKKATYFTQQYANTQNLANGVTFSDKNWNFSYNFFHKTYKLISELKNSFFGKSKSYDNNITTNISQNLTLTVLENGIVEHDISCKGDDNTKKVLEDFLKEMSNNEIKIEDILFIFGLKRLDLNNTIEQNDLKNGHKITMISGLKLNLI